MAEHPMMLAKRIVHLLQTARLDLTSEDATHRGILRRLDEAGITYVSEAVLKAPPALNPRGGLWLYRTPRQCRIDVLCDSVGIEVKVGHQRRSIHDQLTRYGACEEIEALVLATGTPWPASITKIGDVPLFTADLSRGWL